LNFQQLSYLVGESFRTLFRHKGVMILSIIIMSLSLLVLAVFLLATDNVFSLLQRAHSDLKIYVYLDDGVTQDQIEQQQAAILSLHGVETVAFISKEDAMAEFREGLGEEANVLDAMESNPLPASFRVTLKPSMRDLKNAERIAASTEQIEGVEEVNYGRDFLERFAMLARGFMYVDVVLGVIVLISSVFIMSNTVRLTIFSRRNTVEILKLVGATNRFIRTPFLIEGAFQGALASGVSLVLLFGIYALIKKMLPDLSFLPVDKMLMYVLTCVILGSIGSYAALRRFLHL
jgi:cell division transport system permease protein